MRAQPSKGQPAETFLSHFENEINIRFASQPNARQ